jgi:NAD-dependent deacetylase
MSGVPSHADDDVAVVADTLAAATNAVLVVTGAGISHASGIATFRGTDPGAVWATSVKEKATWAYFERDPVGSWTWYLARFDGLAGKLPNPGHQALTALEAFQEARGGSHLLVTQNIDCLHEAAGARRLVKVHGSSDRVRCVGASCANAAPAGTLARADVNLEPFAARPATETLPRCPTCGDLLRPHVLWFDETYDEHRDYQFDVAMGAAQRAQVVLFVGTSFAVGITDLIVHTALQQGAALISVDPSARAPHASIRTVAAAAEVFLPAVMARLTAR